MARIDLEGAVEVGDRTLQVSEGVTDRPAVVVRLGITGGELDRAIEVVDGSRQVPQTMASDAPVVIRLGVVGGPLEGSVEVGEGAGAIAPDEADRTEPAVLVGLGGLDHGQSSSVVGPRMSRVGAVRDESSVLLVNPTAP
jgi:hypothetical protein